jgi:hypothetical protein
MERCATQLEEKATPFPQQVELSEETPLGTEIIREDILIEIDMDIGVDIPVTMGQGEAEYRLYHMYHP